jgi:hypothetical protein
MTDVLATWNPGVTTTDMPPPIHQIIQRNPGTKEIDVKLSLHVFAKELIGLRDEERRIRTSRRYRNAIRAVLKEYGTPFLQRGELVQLVVKRLKFKAADKDKLLAEVWDHIQFNRQGSYLRWTSGKGVELVKP